MQGTQYAPRESILCMEHFVALQRAQGDNCSHNKQPKIFKEMSHVKGNLTYCSQVFQVNR